VSESSRSGRGVNGFGLRLVVSVKVRISVITAVFNNREMLPGALDSILSQSYPNVETLVIDGASSDGTLEVLQQYRGRLSFSCSEPDRGLYDALNKGISRASGDVIGFLHSDDVFGDSDVLARVALAFADPEVQAVYGDLLYVRRDNLDAVVRYWSAGQFCRERLGWGWMPPHPTLYVRREVFQRVGGFDTSYRISADYDHILRVFSQPELNAVYLPSVLVRMRLGGSSNRSLPNILRKSSEDYRALRENRVGGLGTLAWKNLRKVGQFLRRGSVGAA